MRTITTFSQAYKTTISLEEAFRKIYSIFSKNTKRNILYFISELVMAINLENSAENLQPLQYKYLQLETELNIIHKRALLLLSQIFFSFDAFSNNKNLKVTVQEARDLFLCANEILNLSESSKDRNSDIKLFYNFHKFAIDLISVSDINCFSNFYPKIYNLLKISDNFYDYNKSVEEVLGTGIENYTSEVIKMMNNAGKVGYKIVKENFSIPFSKTYLEWTKRTPQLQIPYEYKFLQTFPVVLLDNETFPICTIDLLFIAMIKKIYFILRGRYPSQFGKDWGKIVENEISNYFREKIVGKEIREIQNLYISINGKEIELADFGIILNNTIFLIEVKSGMLSLNEKYSPSMDEFKKAIDKRYVEKEGINQELNRLQDLDNNFDFFCIQNNIDPSLKYNLIPIVIFLDDDLSCMGANKYFGNQFILKKEERKIKFEKFKCEVNTIMTFVEFIQTIEEIKEPLKILNSLIEYNMEFFNDQVSYYPYTHFVSENILHRKFYI